jgi:hypothetical protein
MERTPLMVALTFQSKVNDYIVFLQNNETTDFSYAEKHMISPKYIKSIVHKFRHFQQYNADAAFRKRDYVKYKGPNVRDMFVR